MSVEDIEISPGEEVSITIPYKKQMKNFNQYPNEIERGINIESSPIFYKEKGDKEYSFSWSNSMLVIPSSPDSAMPFIIGVLSVFQTAFTYLNAFYLLVPAQSFA